MSRDDTTTAAPPDTYVDEDQFYPDRQRGLNSRFALGLLMLVLAAAVVLALWFLLIDRDDNDTQLQAAVPTPLTVPTSAPEPTAVPEPTAGPLPTATPVPSGFEACGEERAPVVGRSYYVNTNTTPLNQRTEPAVGGELVGSFPPATADLRFTGDCLVNIADGYIWWQINTDTTTVWVASDFLSPS